MHSIRTQGLTTFEETIVKIQLHATKDVSHYNVMMVMIIVTPKNDSTQDGTCYHHCDI